MWSNVKTTCCLRNDILQTAFTCDICQNKPFSFRLDIKHCEFSENFVNNLLFSYTINPNFVKEIGFSFMINNILNEEYESNAWVYRYSSEDTMLKLDGYFPQAGINFMAGISVKF